MKMIIFTACALLLFVHGAKGFCTGVPNLTYVRSPNACYLYYSCINGIAYPQSCTAGLHFSMELQRCVNPAESDCDIESLPELPEAPVPEASPMCTGVADYRYLEEPSSCERYYQCIAGIAYKLACPRYHVFSEGLQRCGNRYEIGCQKENIRE